MLSIKQNYVFQALLFCYSDLKNQYLTCSSKTRNKLIPVPMYKLEQGKKHYMYAAIKFFNTLPVPLKKLKRARRQLREI